MTGDLRYRAAYSAIELYDPGRVPVEIDLSDNTNLFGVPPSARAVLVGFNDATVTRYPTPFATALKAALAERHGVLPENIVTGCGSDDVIDSAVRAFCEPGDSVVFPSPTFGVVRTFALMNATRPRAVPMTADFSFDTAQVIGANGRLTYVCTPNNPTGTVTASSQIEELDRDLGGLLILDEAYADYGEADHGAFVASSKRTVSLRTFSKALGLAGMRIGYAIGPAPVIHEIEKSRGPYKVGNLAEAVAIRVLQADGAWMADVVERTVANRKRLAADLARRGLHTWPSSGNFLLVQLPDNFSAAGTSLALRQHGVAVRPFGALPHAGECIRVTIGPGTMMDRLVQALSNVLEGEPL